MSLVRPRTDNFDFDVFISHASEDKESVGLPLAEGLRALGYRVWLDEWEIMIGDSLSESVDRGLALSRSAVVVLSQAFLRKRWTKRELRGLVTREMTGDDVILPVLHGVRPSDIANVSPPLADLLAADTANGIDVITRQIGRTLDKRRGSPFWLCHLLDVRADDAQSLAGSTLHLCYRIENENSEAAHIWLGASLVGAGRHEFCDPANDIRVDVAPGEDEYGRRFALPADLEAASYRLIGGLWLNRVGSGGERIHTRSASRPVVVQGESSD